MIRVFPVQSCLEPDEQHFTRFLPFVGSWLADNFYEENNLCNVVLTTLGQHCIGILSSQCCLNTSKTIWRTKKYLWNFGQEGAQTCFYRKISYTTLSWSLWANIAQEHYLCNVGTQPTNNFAQKKNLQFCLDLSEPTLYKEIACAVLAHSAKI